MIFEINEEQKVLKQMVHSVAEKEITPYIDTSLLMAVELM